MNISQKENPIPRTQLSAESIPVTTVDFLVVSYLSPVAVGNIIITPKVIGTNGNVSQWTEIRPLTIGPPRVDIRIPMTNGNLVSVSVAVDSNTVLPSSIHVRCLLAHGATVDQAPVFSFISGYISKINPLHWPFGSTVASTFDRGRFAIATGAGGAGSPIFLNPTGGYTWRPHTLRFTYTADATVINRFPYVTIRAGATEEIKIYTGATITAGQTRQFNGYEGAPLGTLINTDFVFPFKLDWLSNSGFDVTIDADNRQAGDNINTAIMLAEIFVDTDA